MSELPPATLTGPGAAPPALTGPRAPAAVPANLSARLAVGMQVEIQPGRLISPDLLEVRLLPLDGGSDLLGTSRAQLAKPLPDQIVQQLTSAANTGTDAHTPRMRAEVISLGPSLVLRIVSVGDTPGPSTAMAQPQAQAQAPTTATREWVNQQYRENWPESRPLGTTLDTLIDRIRDAEGPAMLLSSTDSGGRVQVQRAFESFVSQLARTQDLTDPDRLSTAVSRSGLWLESLAAQAVANPSLAASLALDLKAQLLNLAQEIRVAKTTSITTKRRAQDGDPSPVEASQAPGLDPKKPVLIDQPPDPATLANPPKPDGLAREVDGMIKQVVTRQLQTLDAEASQPQWFVEIPFKTAAGVIALEADIRRESRSERPEDACWSMRIHLDLPRLGPLNLLLSLRGERFNASLQAETETSAGILQQNLETLRAQLEARDIEVASLHAGYRPAERPAPPVHSPLVSEQA